MTPAPLPQELDRFFRSSLDGAAALSELEPLRAVLERAWFTLKSPMRVAFIGGVNNGKSTLMNAFLGDHLAETGNRELTWNVTWFSYGDRRELRVHNLDGTIEEERFESLWALTTRCNERRELLDRIAYVEARCPSELLKRFDLIDTPGLYSAQKKDSANTRRFLADEQTRPHAVVFLFSETLKAQDIQELDAFHALNRSAVTGINAIGALTKADNYPAGLETANRIINQIRTDYPWTLRRFYTILPVMGQPAFGIETLTADDRQTLLALASLNEAAGRRLLLDARMFVSGESPREMPLPSAEARSALFERLGLWGIRRTVAELRRCRPLEEALSSILVATNLRRLREIVISHFGNRALLIQARCALDIVRDEAFHWGERLRGSAQAEAYRIAAAVDEIRVRVRGFREFAVLEMYYRDGLELDSRELGELLDVTGENGTSCARRLGVDPDTPISEMAALAAARESSWRAKSSDYLGSLDFQQAARSIANLYGELHERLCVAARHLDAAAALLDGHQERAANEHADEPRSRIWRD